MEIKNIEDYIKAELKINDQQLSDIINIIYDLSKEDTQIINSFQEYLNIENLYDFTKEEILLMLAKKLNYKKEKNYDN